MLRTEFLPFNVELKHRDNLMFKTTKISIVDIIVIVLLWEDIYLHVTLNTNKFM
jgi:hypothetical protein